MSISKETLAILRSVRTTDIADALDSMGLQVRYEMDLEMRPMYQGIQFAGIADTAEFKLVDRVWVKNYVRQWNCPKS